MVKKEIEQSGIAEVVEDIELNSLLLEVEKSKEETPVVLGETGRKKRRYPEGPYLHY